MNYCCLVIVQLVECLIKNNSFKGSMMYQNLVEKMSEKGYTRVFIANYLEIGTNTLWYKMTGQTDFTISEINKLCELFNEPFEFLFKKIQSEKTA